MNKFLKNWKAVILTLPFILIFAFVIRIYHLTILPVFADEAIYIRWSQVMSAEATLRFLPLSDGKQPLFMWVLMFVVRRYEDPLFIGRFLSVLTGMGTLLGIFSTSYILFKNKTYSLLSSIFWAVSPISYFFDRMALVDSMLTMFGVWFLFFLILTAKLKRLDTAMIAGFMLGFALLTKSPALFFVILIPTTWVYSKGIKDFAKTLALNLVTLSIGYAMYNVLRLGPDFNQIASRNLDYVFPISHLWTNPKDPFIFHIKEIFTDWFIKMGPGIALVLGVAGIIINIKKRPKELIILVSWFLFPLLIQSEYAKVFTLRYVLMTIPFLVMLSALPILSIQKKVKIVSISGIIVFILQSLLFDQALATNPASANLPSSERSGYLEEWTAGTGIREVANLIKNEHLNNPQERIVVGTEGYFGTLPDGLQIYLNNYPKIVVIGTGVTFEDVPKELKDSSKSGNVTYFVVNSSRLYIKPSDYPRKGLILINSYPKAPRREKESKEYIMYGPRESLLLFKLTQPIIPKTNETQK